jgi:uncharacterized protein with HEPN domain
VKSSPSKNSHPEEAYLQDMLDSARAVQKYMTGVSADAFWEDEEKRDAVTMRLGVIGEAARFITTATAAKLTAIPFHLVRGMRNRIAHDYKGINYREVWRVTQDDIPALIDALTTYFVANPAPVPTKTGVDLAREKDSAGSKKSGSS